MGAPQYEQAGADVAGSGTTNTIPRWTGPSTLGDSGLIDDSTSIYTSTRRVGVDTSTTLANVKLQVGSASALSNYQGAPVGVILPAGSGSWLEFAENSTNGTAFRITKDSNTGVILNANGKDVGFDAGAYESLISGCQMVLKTSGNVGIGTAGPAARLDVVGGTGIRVNEDGSGTKIITVRSNFAGVGPAINVTTNDPLLFQTNNTERARIDSAGRLLVGTSTAPAGSGIMALVGNATRSGMEWNDNTGGFAIIPSGANNANLYAVSGAPGAETYTQVGAITNTSLNISTQAGYGLKLPATPGNTDPNTLDCYADGGTANSGGVAWTPELRFGGATTGITYTTRVGRYTRVGNMIFATCYIALSSKGSATGAATIAGLPTSSNTSGLFSSGSIGYNVGVTYTNMLLVRMNANASAVTLTSSSAAGALANTLDTDFTNTSELVFSIAYPVT